MVSNLGGTEAGGRFAKKLQTCLKAGGPVVDETGYLPLSRTGANVVFQLVSRRYERGSTIVTSNKAFIEWGQGWAMTSCPQRSSTAFCTTATSSPLTAPSYRLE
jgi:DNA replication protein DnaC